MSHAKSGLVRDPQFGFLKAESMPDRKSLLNLYEAEYYEAMQDHDRRFQESDDERMEREWQRRTFHKDIIDILVSLNSGTRVLDLGAGLGELVESFDESGFDAAGVELSKTAVYFAKGKNRNVMQGDIESFSAQSEQQQAWDAVLLLKVLEHTPNPSDILSAVLRLVKPGGLVVIQIPNDFSALQEMAEKTIEPKEWWVSLPHHLHYFNFETLRAFLEGRGLNIEYQYSDFPMELFLMMGDDYVSDPKVGPKLHAKRRSLEMALTDTIRQKMYTAFAEIGIGRSATIFARLPG